MLVGLIQFSGTLLNKSNNLRSCQKEAHILLKVCHYRSNFFVISIFFIVEIIAEWCNEAVPLAGGYLKEFIHSVKAYAEICTTSVVLARKDLFQKLCPQPRSWKLELLFTHAEMSFAADAADRLCHRILPIQPDPQLSVQQFANGSKFQ